MKEEIIYLGCILAMIIPITYALMFVVKYYYISAICREWNKKLYSYTKHLEHKKSSGKLKNDYRYLEDMYLFPDEIKIYVFKNWKESDLIPDKFTLFNVNEYNNRKSFKKK
jgi:hypothetical protein